MARSLTAIIFIFSALPVFAQPDTAALAKIKKTSDADSHVMKIISQLTDVYGPRLMGTPNYYASVLWIEGELKKSGITNIQKQSFDNGHLGWELVNYKMELTEPVKSPIHAYPLAYTSSTRGEATGEVIYLKNLDSVYSLKGQLNNKVLLMGSSYQQVTSFSQPFSERLTAATLKQAEENPDPNDLIIGYHSRRSTKSMYANQLLRRKQKESFFNFCSEEGVLALVEPSDFPYGILHADGNGNVPSYMKTSDIRPIASFVMANEHFGRIVRLLNLGFKPRLKVNLEVKFHSDPRYNVNLIADNEGSDAKLKDELVIIGAHLDSWHGGTGAADNAAGSAATIEAMRLIRLSGLKPRRTIRLALWGGEEQVFAGSSSYVSRNVGDMITALPKGQKEKISAYFNLDNGAGKIRGLYLMGNEKAKPVFKGLLGVFPENNTLTIQNANQTDHEIFDVHNIPAFQFIQDPLDLMNALHHTNMDVYEYVPPTDQQFNAVYIAHLAYAVAQLDHLLPRKNFNSPVPIMNGNTKFEVKGFSQASEVHLVGDFNNWSMFGTPLMKTKDGWECKIELPKGTYLYKYIIDGMWTADPSTPENQLKKDGKGHAGLTEITVK